MRALPPVIMSALLGLLALPAHAGRADVGGYFRIMTRPDLQGGTGTLGYWNLYGRLLNEGPYAALELRFDVLEREPGTQQAWSSLHAKIEGGSIGNADAGNGVLDAFRMSQLYVQSGNVLIDDVVWQVGTLDTYFGDLGLYDMRPAQIFYETVGASARWQTDTAEVLVGVGDSGWYTKGQTYNSIITPGGTIRGRLGEHVEIGTGGMYRFEPQVTGNQYAPHVTPGVDYADFLRGEVVQSYLQDNPNQELDFPDPVPTSAQSWKVIGYLGFGNLGPLRWNSLFASYERLHPELLVTETYDGDEYDIYVHDLTDQRTALWIGNEAQLTLWPGRLDMALAGLYGHARDADNTIAPSDHARQVGSGVLRLQAYLTDTVHWLGETSLAREFSTNGNRYREHYDSIFENTGGVSDTMGLEYGDTDTRDTWQGKTGFVLSPLGPGVYTRPSLRLLYGTQYSNQNNAFGTTFVDSLAQYDDFQAVERHWHHMVALEMEAWF